MGATPVSVEKQMDKDVIHTIYSGILFNHKKERNLAICNMDVPRGDYAK